MNIKDIADVYGVKVEDVAVRVEFSNHLYINQKRLCGGSDMNKVPGFTDAGIKIPTHADFFGNHDCKSCFKILSKKMGA